MGGGEGIKGEGGNKQIELIIIRVSNEWRVSCKPLSGFFSHHADHPNEPPFDYEEGRACFTGLDAKRHCQRSSHDR